MSPARPHCGVSADVKPEADVSTNHALMDGRKTAWSSLPSPSKSPGTGTSSLTRHLYTTGIVKLLLGCGHVAAHEFWKALIVITTRT